MKPANLKKTKKAQRFGLVLAFLRQAHRKLHWQASWRAVGGLSTLNVRRRIAPGGETPSFFFHLMPAAIGILVYKLSTSIEKKKKSDETFNPHTISIK